MSIHQLKDGRWIIKAAKGSWPDDPERTRQYFGRGVEAERAAQGKSIELVLNQGKAKTGPTLHDLTEQYMISKRATISPANLKDIAWKLEATILPALGHLAAINITPAELDHYVTIRIAAGRKLTTVHRELSIIRAIIRWGVRRRAITHNPMDGYEMPRRDDAIISPPTMAELAAIYNAAAPHLQRVIMLAYYTGMRPGMSELLALRWERVDLINGTLFVESAKKGGMASRSVPIADPLAQLLRQWLADDQGAGRVELVVHYHGRRVERIKTAWRSALTRAGITRRIRPYDLRHLAATTMLEAGGDLKSVSEILGHASPEMTMRVYQHASTQLRRDTIARFGNQLPAGIKIEDEKTGK